VESYSRTRVPRRELENVRQLMFSATGDHRPQKSRPFARAHTLGERLR
jgi:hypothetical protein